MRIPFDISKRPQIESGEYKVETEEGSPARIICWDSPINKERPIIAIVFDDQIEQYKADGRYDNDYDRCNYDLFIVTPEPEMSEFEKAVGLEIFDEPFEEKHIKVIKEESAKLLSIARKELELKIKAEALKDLPRWKKCPEDDPSACVYNCAKREDFLLYYNGHTLKLIDLEKLPGFKEDESHE